MSLSFANHEQKILDEIIRSLESRARLAEGCQIFSFNLIKGFGISYEQPDGGMGRKFLDAVQVSRGFHFCLLERFQVTVDGSFCSGVALFLDFFPKSETYEGLLEESQPFQRPISSESLGEATISSLSLAHQCELLPRQVLASVPAERHFDDLFSLVFWQSVPLTVFVSTASPLVQS